MSVGMQTIREYFPWVELFEAPRALYCDFFLRNERVYFPQTLPEILDVYQYSTGFGWAALEVVWFHLAGLDPLATSESSIQVPAAGAVTD